MDPDLLTVPPVRSVGKDRSGAQEGWHDCPIGRPGVPRRMPPDRLAPGDGGADDSRVIHDVDQLLEKLVKRDALNGSSVDLVFEAPTKDWVARRSGPAVDLYLYDIREDLQRRVPAWEDVRGANGQVSARRQPPRRFRLAYLVTAWTQRPEDEHRLLSSLLACFLRNPMIKPEALDDPLNEADLPVYLEVGQPASQERSLADVWSALGGELKPSLDLVVIAPIVIDSSAYVGPPITEGPSIGLASTGGASETHQGKARHGTTDEVEDAVAELLPANAGPKDGGVRIRVRGAPRTTRR